MSLSLNIYIPITPLFYSFHIFLEIQETCQQLKKQHAWFKKRIDTKGMEVMEILDIILLSTHFFRNFIFINKAALASLRYSTRYTRSIWWHW